MFLEKNIYLNAHFLTGSSREIIAEFSGLREAEEHGQQSWDHQEQRAGNYTQETSKQRHHFHTSYLIISCMKIKTKTKLCLVDGPSCKIHRGHARRLWFPLQDPTVSRWAFSWAQTPSFPPTVQKSAEPELHFDVFVFVCNRPSREELWPDETGSNKTTGDTQQTWL